MAKIRALLGKIRIEYFAVGLFILTTVVFALRLYVCRFDGAIVLQVVYGALPQFISPLARALILDACFATVGFMVFEKGYTKHAKLAFKIGFGVAALLFVLDLLMVLLVASNDPLAANSLYFGRMELGTDSLLVGGFGLGFYLYIVLLLVYGAIAFLHPGYAGADEPTLYAFIVRKVGKRDPLTLLPAGSDPVLAKDVPLAVFYTIITFGVYYFFWMYHVIKAMRKIMNDASSPQNDFLLSLLVLPGIQIMFALNMKKYEEYLFANRERLGIKKGDMSIAYLVLTLIGLGPIAVVMMQLDLNRAMPARIAETVVQPAA